MIASDRLQDIHRFFELAERLFGPVIVMPLDLRSQHRLVILQYCSGASVVFALECGDPEAALSPFDCAVVKDVFADDTEEFAPQRVEEVRNAPTVTEAILLWLELCRPDESIPLLSEAQLGNAHYT